MHTDLPLYSPILANSISLLLQRYRVSVFPLQEIKMKMMTNDKRVSDYKSKVPISKVNLKEI